MSLVIRSPIIRAVLIASSLTAVIGAAMTATPILLVLALLLLLPVATSLSQAGRLAAALQSFRRRAVQAIVWGRPIPGPQVAELRVESIGAVGAGLLIYLADAGEPKTLLKVAQPRSWQVGDGRVIIDEAAYVQWAGKRLERAEGFPALAISASSQTSMDL